MPSHRALAIHEDYKFNHWLIHKMVDGITHEQSMLVPFESNPLNWVLGHIVGRRGSALQAVSGDLGLDDQYFRTYGTGSDPLRDPGTAIRFDALIGLLDRSQSELGEILKNIDDDELDQLVVNDRGEKPAIEHLRGFHWHETYHIGQLEILRAFIESQR